MQRLFSLFLGFVVGLLFMVVPLNPGVHGFILQAVQSLVNFIGFMSVTVFGSIILYDALGNIKIKDRTKR